MPITFPVHTEMRIVKVASFPIAHSIFMCKNYCHLFDVSTKATVYVVSNSTFYKQPTIRVLCFVNLIYLVFSRITKKLVVVFLDQRFSNWGPLILLHIYKKQNRYAQTGPIDKD